jgi:hypothetical protein
MHQQRTNKRFARRKRQRGRYNKATAMGHDKLIKGTGIDRIETGPIR